LTISETPGRIGTVEFELPDRHNSSVQAWFCTVYFLALAVWSVAGSWQRHRLLGIVAALFFLELLLTALQVRRKSGSVRFDEVQAGRVAAPLDELCRRAGCLAPKVQIRDQVVRAAAVASIKGRTTLVLSGPFVDLLDDHALRAILAHEVIHVVEQDLEVLRRLRLVSVLIYVAVTGMALVLYGHDYGALCIFFGLLAVQVARVFLAIFNRSLECRADADGARLCGDPLALATALEVARSVTELARRRVYGPKPWRWILSPLAWPLPSHPRMARRVARLRELAHSEPL
jgi:heat shock protein HtpX